MPVTVTSTVRVGDIARDFRTLGRTIAWNATLSGAAAARAKIRESGRAQSGSLAGGIVARKVADSANGSTYEIASTARTVDGYDYGKRQNDGYSGWLSGGNSKGVMLFTTSGGAAPLMTTIASGRTVRAGSAPFYQHYAGIRFMEAALAAAETFVARRV